MIISCYHLADGHLPPDLMTAVSRADTEWMDDAWTIQNWQSSYSESYYLMVLGSNPLQAFALFYIAPNDDQAHLLKIAVSHILRGQGIGLQFLTAAMSELKKKRLAVSVYLEVRESNMLAIKLYERLGFSDLRIIKNFYHDGESARAMHKDL